MGYKSLAESVLLAPAKDGADRLCILTKSAAPNMVSWLLLNHIRQLKTPVIVELMIDASAAGVEVSAHESYRDLHSIVPHFVCSYIYEPITVGTNLYIWLRNDSPAVAYAGTAVFEQGYFLAKANGSLALCDAAGAWAQFQSVVGSSIYCHHFEVEEHVVICQAPAGGADGSNHNEEVILPLVTKRTGEPGVHSGLNWGQRKGRNPNQAYIPLPIKVARSGFFPVEPIDAPPHFSVVTDDKRQLILRIEQQNQKAIATPLSNALLGEYFRNRLGLAFGSYVTRADLERYGRTDVKFVKLDSEHYYMDFSV